MIQQEEREHTYSHYYDNGYGNNGYFSVSLTESPKGERIIKIEGKTADDLDKERWDATSKCICRARFGACYNDINKTKQEFIDRKARNMLVEIECGACDLIDMKTEYINHVDSLQWDKILEEN